MRLFYAALFDNRTLKTIENLQKELHHLVSKGRFISKENFHITLHFLGEQRNEELPEYCNFLEEASKDIDPILINFTSFGTFPRRGEHLIYLKADPIPKQEDRLQLPAQRLKELTGEGDRRRVKPHITLVRRGVVSEDNLKILKDLKFDFPPSAITTLALMESTRINGKLVYIPIHSVDIG